MNNIQLPNKLSLSQFTGLPKFEGTEDGDTERSMLNDAQNNYQAGLKRCKILKWICFVVGFYVCFGTSAWYLGVLIMAVGFFGFTQSGVLAKKYKEELSAAIGRYNRYLDKLAQYAANNIFSENYRWVKFGNKYMLYGREGLVHVDTDQDLLVAYNKKAIKDVTKERVHTGSHTTSNTTGVGVATSRSNTQTNGNYYSYLDKFQSQSKTSGLGIGVSKARTDSDTTQYYEWHFDVLTDYINYPKVSLIIGDNKNNESIVNEMYGILKP